MSFSTKTERNFYDLSQLRKEVFNDLVSQAAIYQAIREGRIPSVRFGRRILVPASWIKQFTQMNHVKI